MAELEVRGPKLSVVAPQRPKEVPLDSWEAETVLDYDKVYARKYSEDFRDDTATVWKSMYEKNLGRKVSRLPPWEIALTGRKDSQERHFGNPDLKDLASIHLDRAKNMGAMSEQPPFQTAESRRKERKHRHASAGENGKHKHHHHHHHHHKANKPNSPTTEEERK